MAKQNFSADRIAAFKCKASCSQSIYWDAKTPGLGLRVTAAGAKAYIFETRLHGRTLRMTIGSIDTWTIGNAQKRATELKASTDKGIDPREVKRDDALKAETKRTEAKRQSLTLGDVWPLYLEAHKAEWSALNYRDHVNLASAGGQLRKRGKGLTVARPLAVLMPLLLSELSSERIVEWLRTESRTRPTSAALSYRLLRGFTTWAAGRKAYRNIVPVDSCSAPDVKKAVPKSHAKIGDCLQREQLPLWFDAVRKSLNPIHSAYLQALLLTGARREEMAALRWDDVDFKWRSLTIRDKVDGSRTIPLTPYLASLLMELKRRNDAMSNVVRLQKLETTEKKCKPSPWVFSSATGIDGRLKDPRKAHVDALTAAGLPHITLHGLRRSFGTLNEWPEMPSGITAQIMGHKPSALVEKHYIRRPLDLLRKWHDKSEAWFLEQACIEFAPQPLSLKSVAKA